MVVKKSLLLGIRIGTIVADASRRRELGRGGRVRRTSVAIALAIALAGFAPGLANGSAGSRQTASYTFTTTTPGAPTGYRLAVDFQNPQDPRGKPYSVAEWIITLPAGTKLDNNAIPQCTAGDAAFYLEGASACPADSRVGGGTIITDFGSPGGLPRYGDNAVTQFNGDHQYIAYAETQNPPTRAVSHTTIDGERLTSPIPTFPGLPPPDPYLAFQSVRLSGPAIVHDGRATARTPASCPSSGYWTTTLTFVYHDGVSQTVTSDSPCRPLRDSR
jgi:hypothetical protein